MTMKCVFQRHYRSNVKTDSNLQHMGCYLFRIQSMVLSVTVYERHNISFCTEIRKLYSDPMLCFLGEAPTNRDGEEC